MNDRFKNKIKLSYRIITYSITSISCAALIGLSIYLKISHVQIPEESFLILHTILEFLSIVVCFAVFFTGWFAYRQTFKLRDIYLGITFFIVGALDFVHVLSYKGMPVLFTGNAVGNAAAFWLSARLCFGIGIIATLLASKKDNKNRMPTRFFILSAILFVIILLSIFSRYDSSISNSLYNPISKSLTPLKIAFEFIIMVIYTIAIIMMNRTRIWIKQIVVLFQSSLIISIFGEICFSLYTSPYEVINGLGHVLKACSYLIVLNTVFLSSLQQPYMSLSAARDTVRKLYLESKRSKDELEQAYTQIGTALASELELQKTCDLISKLIRQVINVESSLVVIYDEHETKYKALSYEGKTDVENALQFTKRSIKEDICSSNSTLYLENPSGNYNQILCYKLINNGLVSGFITVAKNSKTGFSEAEKKTFETFCISSSVAIQNALNFERERKIADILQQSIMQSSFSIKKSSYSISHIYKPALNEALIGGDFFDVFNITEDKIAIVIGDVSGKGLSAAVHTSMAKNFLRAYLSEGHTPSKSISLLNSGFIDYAETESFITIFCGILDTHTHIFEYTNAGHEPQIYIKDEVCTYLQPNGPIVGLDANSVFVDEKLETQHNSLLVLYTDGISESRLNNVMFSIDNICKTALEHFDDSTQSLVKQIYDTAVEFGGGQLKDDAVVLAIKAKDKLP